METKIILYPAVSMIFLTLFLYAKNYLDNVKAKKAGIIKFSYFRTYTGEVPDYMYVSRQTLKNQFELPIFFYFLISVILVFDNVSQLDVIFAWLFVVSRYVHCYIRLTSNNVLYRSKFFIIGMLLLVIWWVIFLYQL